MTCANRQYQGHQKNKKPRLASQTYRCSPFGFLVSLMPMVLPKGARRPNRTQSPDVVVESAQGQTSGGASHPAPQV